MHYGVPGEVKDELGPLIQTINSDQVGEEIHALMSQLYPICRSITGNGVRQTLRIIGEQIPLLIHEVPTGTQVFDWTVPKEWNIRDAWVKGLDGETIIDFKKSNLHVVSYSVPVRKKVSLEELKQHLFTSPEHPDWIPYRTSYYQENWGFCLSHRQFLELQEEEYEVLIDSSLADGFLTYGECYLPGETSDEVLIACHSCHPSLCNDSLSGVALAVVLAKCLGQLSLKYSYRFLFAPATIGAITWLCLNEPQVSRVKHGLVAVCVGDPGTMTYKKSRQGDAEIDRAVMNVLKSSQIPHRIVDFSPYGGDERQFCSPGFNLPVGSLMRTPYGEFAEYHTSADNPTFVRSECLGEALAQYMRVFGVLEGNGRYLNCSPKCEPQLGKRGLYGAIGGRMKDRSGELAMLWVLNFSDGNHSLLDISNRSDLAFDVIREAATALLNHGLLTAIRE